MKLIHYLMSPRISLRIEPSHVLFTSVLRLSYVPLRDVRIGGQVHNMIIHVVVEG